MPVFSEEALNQALRNTINEVLVVSAYAIRSQQRDAPRARGGYASVNLISSAPIGTEEISSADQEGGPDTVELVETQRSVMYSLTFHRLAAFDNCEKVRIALASRRVMADWELLGISLTRVSALRNTSTALENGWEERAQFDVTLNIVSSYSRVATSIQTAAVEIEYQSPEGNETIEIEVS